jgi:hypothetical protein
MVGLWTVVLDKHKPSVTCFWQQTRRLDCRSNATPTVTFLPAVVRIQFRHLPELQLLTEATQHRDVEPAELKTRELMHPSASSLRCLLPIFASNLHRSHPSILISFTPWQSWKDPSFHQRRRPSCDAWRRIDEDEQRGSLTPGSTWAERVRRKLHLPRKNRSGRHIFPWCIGKWPKHLEEKRASGPSLRVLHSSPATMLRTLCSNSHRVKTWL